MKGDTKRFLSATAILVGTCIGAGVLAIPYIAAQSGFFVALAYIVLIGLMLMLINLYLGEVSLRTKGNHQLAGYAEKYLGRKAGWVMEFAFVFGIYAAIVAYILGVGQSVSLLIYGDASSTLLFGILFGLFMSVLIWRGLKSLKKFEMIGVSFIFTLLVLIFIMFIGDVSLSNLTGFNLANIFLPFGVVLFSLLSFSAIPEVNMILKRNEHLMKKSIISAILFCICFYSLFAFIVVGAKGIETPEIATLALGTVFVFFGILTMFTSYLALGNALKDNMKFDEKKSHFKAWIYSAIVPIFLFILINYFGIFSFTKILSIGGVVSGGLVGILILLSIRVAKKKGNRKPEYEMPVNWFVVGFFILVFILGMVQEVLRSF
jgi:tyrosine-specific transport protein